MIRLQQALLDERLAYRKWSSLAQGSGQGQGDHDLIVAQDQKTPTFAEAPSYGHEMTGSDADNIEESSLENLESGDPLVSRAAQIDPRQAVCFNGHYGENFELEDGSTQRVLSSGLIWSDGEDAVPDWAMQAAWRDLKPDWERLQAAGWERDRHNTRPTAATQRSGGYCNWSRQHPS
jgi:hypothetical protein